MADRREYGKGQVVKSTELQASLDALDSADLAVTVDLGVLGISSGITATEDAPVSLNVDVSAGVAYDVDGARIAVPSVQEVDMSTDENEAATTVLTFGNTKWISIMLRFTRSLSDVRVVAVADGGDGIPYFHKQDESFELAVVQGVEAVGPSRPTIPAGDLVVAEVELAFGQTTISDAQLDVTRRTDFAGFLLGAPDLATVLAVGSITGGNDIVVSSGDALTSLDDLTINAHDADPASGFAGKELLLRGGAGDGVGAGADAFLRGGDGGDTAGSGGTMWVRGGTGGAGGGPGGNVVINGGPGTGGGSAGRVNLNGEVRIAQGAMLLHQGSDPDVDVTNLQIYAKTDDNLYVRRANDGRVSQVSGLLNTRHIASNEKVDGTVGLVSIAQFAFNPLFYGDGRTFEFEVLLKSSSGALIATVQLINETDGETVATLNTSSTASVKLNSGPLTVGSSVNDLKDSEKIYRLDLITSGTLIGEFTTLGSAILRVID